MMLPHHHHLLHPSPPPPQAQQPHVAPLALRLPPPPETRKPNTTLNNLSRRDLAIATSSLPLLWALPATPQDLEEKTPQVDINDERTVGKKAFLDISIDGAPAGRVTVGLYTADAPVGASRFLGLITGSTGVSYRRKEFVKILPNYVQHGGVRSYGVDVELATSSGSELAAEGLLGEWERARMGREGKAANVKGTVGIVVRDPLKPPPKAKLVAKAGRLKVEEEQTGKDPNGTEFVIVARESPELDDSVLVVGKVMEGMEVVEKMLKVKTVQENTASPYFRVAKLIGDKRAVVAERGFNRPYSKVVVTNCGLLE